MLAVIAKGNDRQPKETCRSVVQLLVFASHPGWLAGRERLANTSDKAKASEPTQHVEQLSALGLSYYTYYTRSENCRIWGLLCDAVAAGP